jgi:hypothetical protein
MVGDAVLVTAAVRELVIVEDLVCDGVEGMEAVPVMVDVSVCVAVAEEVIVAAAVEDAVADSVAVLDGVTAELFVPDPDRVPVLVKEGVCVPDPVPVSVPVLEGVPVMGPEPVMVCVLVGVAVIDDVTDDVTVGLVVELAVPDQEPVWLGEIHRGVGDRVPVVVRDAVTVAVPLTVVLWVLG